MYGQGIREDFIYLILYGAATATSLLACFYLLFRRTNTIAPKVTPPIRLRRWTAAFYRHAVQTSVILVSLFLVWRVETLSDLNGQKTPAAETLSQPDAEDTPLSCHEAPLPDADETSADSLRASQPQNLTTLLQKRCIDTQLYLQHDLTIQQLAKDIGTNRYYLSQYFSQQGVTYNDYINGLRIDHFVALYRETVTSRHPFTVKQLAQESGYRNYTTFSNAFKRRRGTNVTAWIQESEAVDL